VTAGEYGGQGDDVVVYFFQENPSTKDNPHRKRKSKNEKETKQEKERKRAKVCAG
jgi:hypothetical protein